MKILNVHSLPDSIVRAISNDSYDGPKQQVDKVGITTLIGPPKIHFLKIRHWGEIEEDVSERLWSLLGQAVHSVMERAEDKNTIREERLEEMVDGITVSGQMDLMGKDCIEDYKCTSTWTYIFNPTGKKEWVEQLNCYRWLARKIFDIKRLTVHMILRDHMGSKAKQDPTYPQIPFKSIDCVVWAIGKTEAFIKARVAMFKACKTLTDEQLPDCTKHEMWEKDGTWAIMKPGRKTAVKVCATELEAQNYLPVNPGCSIVSRPGTRNRCENYCPVNKWCLQYKTYRGE